MKKRWIAICSLICIAMILICIIVFRMSRKEGYIFGDAIPIDVISDKHCDDGYYLTVLLPDYVKEEYSLQYDELTLQTSKRIYDQIDVEDRFAGISVRVTIPYGESKKDIGMVLKEKLADYCMIVGVATSDNRTID